MVGRITARGAIALNGGWHTTTDVPGFGPSHGETRAVGWHASVQDDCRSLRRRTMVRLDPEWTELLESYRDRHSDPRNQFCHSVGTPLIVASLPVAFVGIGIPVALGMFVLGWTLQFAGHALEGNRPSFLDDPRNLFVGLLWWLERRGVQLQHVLKVEVKAEK